MSSSTWNSPTSIVTKIKQKLDEEEKLRPEYEAKAKVVIEDKVKAKALARAKEKEKAESKLLWASQPASKEDQIYNAQVHYMNCQLDYEHTYEKYVQLPANEREKITEMRSLLKSKLNLLVKAETKLISLSSK
jgi:hypothetical protein